MNHSAHQVEVTAVMSESSDRHLLTLFQRFRTNEVAKAETAMRTLIERHSPLVLGVCRRLLGEHMDAEDAAQAVFIVLWQKAGTLTTHSIAPWLHRTAILISRNALRARRIRQTHEHRAVMMNGLATVDVDTDWAEVREVIDAEIDQLSEMYRAPLISFHLEGCTVDAIAARCDIPVSTVWTRLARARELLAARLTRRGITMGAALLATGLSSAVQAGSVPVTFSGATTTAAKLFGAGHFSVAGQLSTSTSALAQELLKAAFWTPLKTAMAAAAVWMGCGAVTVGLLYSDQDDKPAQSVPPAIAEDAHDKKIVAETPVTDEQKADEEPADTAVARIEETDPAFGGVEGKVLFEGTAPQIPTLFNSKLRKAVPDPSLVIDPTSRGIANVVIYLRDKPAGTPAPDPNTVWKKRVVDNQQAIFLPHVFTARTGQTILFKNNDQFAITVHPNPLRNPASSVIVPPVNRVGVGMVYSLPESFPMRITDNIHATASCYALILDHPYSAVTDATGKFYIPHLPVGTHSFRVWHERAGYLERDYQATINGAETVILPSLVIPIDKLNKQ